MPASYRRPPRFAVGCALAAIAAVLASPAWADPAPSFAELLARLDQTPATTEAAALLDAAEARERALLWLRQCRDHALDHSGS